MLQDISRIPLPQVQHELLLITFSSSHIRNLLGELSYLACLLTYLPLPRAAYETREIHGLTRSGSACVSVKCYNAVRKVNAELSLPPTTYYQIPFI